MPKIELTTDEATMVLNAIDSEIKSAKRAQNTGKTPQIREVWATHQRVLESLSHKFANAK